MSLVALHEKEGMLEMEHQICHTMWYPTVALKPEGLLQIPVPCHWMSQTSNSEARTLCLLCFGSLGYFIIAMENGLMLRVSLGLFLPLPQSPCSLYNVSSARVSPDRSHCLLSLSLSLWLLGEGQMC